MNDPRLAIAGFITGLLVGMTGMGGGSLMTPILIFFFNFNPASAIGTDILHGAIFKSFGAVRHRRLGTVRARLAAWMLVGSAPASLVGVWVATYLTDRYGDSVDSVQGKVLGYTLLFGAVAFVVKALTHRGGTAATLGRLSTRDRVVAVCIGVVGGFIVGLTSVGSGTLFALAMLLAYPLAAKYVVGTDIAHAAALLWVAGVGHLVAGNVDLTAIGWLLVGSIPGVLIGSQISVGLPETALRIALATCLALSGLKLLDVPYANGIVVVTLAVGLGVLAGWGVVHVVRRSRAAAQPAVVSDAPAFSGFGTNEHVGDVPEVLFVCVHNAGRSQMAAGLMAHRAQGTVRVRSAGSDPAEEINPAVVEAMAELGVDLGEEFPKPLTDEAVRDADAVVTMGCDDACPIYPGKRYLDWELPDPSGQDLETVRAIRDEIDVRVQRLLAEFVPSGPTPVTTPAPPR